MRAFDRAADRGADIGAAPPPGIHHRAEARSLVRRAHRELVVVQFAKHYRAVAPEMRADGRLVGRRKRVENSRARGGAHALGAEQILDAERDSFERTALAFL